MRIADKIARLVNDSFSDKLKEAILEKFGMAIETSYNFLSGYHRTTRVDGKDFTQEEMDFLRAYEDGYVAAMKIVREQQ
ncbi:hypothetical protein LCGC14_2988570 [marine sediment metagenome]|uniref:Uncharacterized protein n=1 Tax=marine sediment metagenome TaxID=412755 RepID=A0A0F8X5E6_9ZZZZ